MTDNVDQKINCSIIIFWCTTC